MNLRRHLSGLAVGAALIVVVSGAIYVLREHVPVLGLAVLYLLAVIPVAVVWGKRWESRCHCSRPSSTPLCARL